MSTKEELNEARDIYNQELKKTLDGIIAKNGYMTRINELAYMTNLLMQVEDIDEITVDIPVSLLDDMECRLSIILEAIKIINTKPYQDDIDRYRSRQHRPDPETREGRRFGTRETGSTRGRR